MRAHSQPRPLTPQHLYRVSPPDRSDRFERGWVRPLRLGGHARGHPSSQRRDGDRPPGSDTEQTLGRRDRRHGPSFSLKHSDDRPVPLRAMNGGFGRTIAASLRPPRRPNADRGPRCRPRAGSQDPDLLAAAGLRAARRQSLSADRGVRSRRGTGLQRADCADPARGRRRRRPDALGRQDVADRIIDRYELTGGGADAVKDVFSPAGGTSTSVGVVGALLLLVAVLSFTRAVQRLFEQTWELAPLSVRNTLNGLRWAAALVAFLVATGWIHARRRPRAPRAGRVPAGDAADRRLPRLERLDPQREADRLAGPAALRRDRVDPDWRPIRWARPSMCRTCSAPTPPATE